MKKSLYLAIISILALNAAAFAEPVSAPSFQDLSKNAGEIAKDGNSALPTPQFSPAGPESGKYNQQNMALRKIKVNEYQPDMEGTLIGKLQKGLDIDKVVKELNDAGLKAQAMNDGLGYYFISVDVNKGDAADSAIGLAKFYYVTEVQVGQKVYNSIFTPPSRSKRPMNRIGSVKGGMNHSPVDLTINKMEWTIKGGMNLSPIDIKIDHSAGTITGGANLSPVDLKFTWSTEETTVEGGANHSPVKYTVNWKNGLLEGYANHSPVRLEFDMKEGVAAFSEKRKPAFKGR